MELERAIVDLNATQSFFVFFFVVMSRFLENVLKVTQWRGLFDSSIPLLIVCVGRWRDVQG